MSVLLSDLKTQCCFSPCCVRGMPEPLCCSAISDLCRKEPALEGWDGHPACLCVHGGYEDHPHRPPAGLESEHLLSGEPGLSASSFRAPTPASQRPRQAGRSHASTVRSDVHNGNWCWGELLSHYRSRPHAGHRRVPVPGWRRRGGGRERPLSAAAGDAATHVICAAGSSAPTCTPTGLSPQEEPLRLSKESGDNSTRP